MNKKKNYRFWCGIFLAFLIVYLIYALFFSKEKNVRTISKAVWLIVIYAAAMCGVRMKKSPNIATYKIYEDKYKDIIGEAFTNDKKSYRLLLKAINCYNNRQYQKTISILESIENKCESYHDTSAVLTFKALAYEDMGQENHAISTYEELLRTDGANSVAWSNLGLLYDKNGNNKDAINAYENAVRYDPYNASAYHNMSNHYIHINEPEKALENALKAIKLDGTLYQAKGNAAYALTILGRIDEARVYYNLYKQYQKDAPSFEETLENIKNVNTNKN